MLNPSAHVLDSKFQSAVVYAYYQSAWLHLHHCRFACNTIEDAGIINRNVLLCNNLDYFLRNYATSEGSDIM